MTTTYNESFKHAGATVGVFTYPLGSKSVCITDDDVKQFRITLWPTKTGEVGVRVDLEWSDEKPGELANFTAEQSIDCAASDVLEINDAGIFTAMARSRAASKWRLNMGLTLQLPLSTVSVVRRGIEIARSLAAEMGVENRSNNKL